MQTIIGSKENTRHGALLSAVNPNETILTAACSTISSCEFLSSEVRKICDQYIIDKKIGGIEYLVKCLKQDQKNASQDKINFIETFLQLFGENM